MAKAEKVTKNEKVEKIEEINIKDMILKYPHPMLMQKAKSYKMTELKKNPHKRFLLAAKRFVQDEENGAAGIALPQIGIDSCAFVVKIFVKGKWVTKVMVNPIIKKIDDNEIVEDIEGCLSLDDQYLVKRVKRITVLFYDENGKSEQQSLGQISTRHFLHEYGHLNKENINEIGSKVEKREDVVS